MLLPGIGSTRRLAWRTTQSSFLAQTTNRKWMMREDCAPAAKSKWSVTETNPKLFVTPDSKLVSTSPETVPPNFETEAMDVLKYIAVQIENDQNNACRNLAGVGSFIVA